MKIKDIKTQLNQEIQATTPDVLDNVKKSPINHLKAGENLRIFFNDKKATLMLAFTLLIVVIFAISMFSFTKNDEDTLPSQPLSYTHIVVDGNEYGVITCDGNVVACHNESANTTFDINAIDNLFDGTSVEDISITIYCQTEQDALSVKNAIATIICSSLPTLPTDTTSIISGEVPSDFASLVEQADDLQQFCELYIKMTQSAY